MIGNAEIRLHWTLVYLRTGNSSTFFPVIQALEFGILEYWIFVYTFFWVLEIGILIFRELEFRILQHWTFVYSFFEYWKFVYCSIGNSSTLFWALEIRLHLIYELQFHTLRHWKFVQKKQNLLRACKEYKISLKTFIFNLLLIINIYQTATESLW